MITIRWCALVVAVAWALWIRRLWLRTADHIVSAEWLEDNMRRQRRAAGWED